MKKIIFAGAIIFMSLFQKSVAQNNTSTVDSNLTKLLSAYYELKDALVEDNASTASAGATKFLKTANGIDYKVISEGNLNALLKDATKISVQKDISKQREIFANLSMNMVTIAKIFKLSNEPVYKEYCPMKKAYWLSSEQEIKNPYYGSSMLSCGEVSEVMP